MRRLRQIRDKQKGTALLLALFALLLLSAIGALMYLAAITETHVGANYSNSLSAYYAANSGLLEVRDRLKYPSTNTAGCGANCGLADKLPTDIAGNANGVLYVVNNVGGEVIDPTDPNNKYFDPELCHDYNSGVGTGSRCTAPPTVPNWNLPMQAAVPGANPLPYKWVRLNMKTNRIAAPYFVDGDGSTAPLDTPVCWDGTTEQLLPSGGTPRCDANGMQNVYMLTSLAATSGLSANAARRLLRFEVVPPSIRPPGAITMDASAIGPTLGSGIPSTVVDGRAHDAQGGLLARNAANPSVPATNNKCSDVAALATDAPQSSTEIEQALNDLRKSIVIAANNSCSASGSGINGNSCPPGLWWVRGIGSSPRFITSIQVPNGTSNNGGPGKSDGDDSGGFNTIPCTSANPSCYTNLNLAAPELMAVSASIVPNTNPPILSVVTQSDKSAPFTGIPGNQPDSTVYQAASAATLPDEIAALKSLISTSTNLPNYYSVTGANLAGSYGSSSSPAIVVVTDSSLTLTKNLTGFGILVVPSDFEVQAALQWTGIVLVRPPDPTSTGSTTSGSTPSTTAKFGLGSGGSGSIIGALLIQAQTANLTTAGGSGAFRVSYSCDAIDLAFSSLPFKVVSSSERSF
jgi:hypothetical protein